MKVCITDDCLIEGLALPSWFHVCPVCGYTTWPLEEIERAMQEPGIKIRFIDDAWYPACHDKITFGEDFEDGCGGALLDGAGVEDDVLLDVCVKCPFRTDLSEEDGRL